jgi:hypothetical protein
MALFRLLDIDTATPAAMLIGLLILISESPIANGRPIFELIVAVPVHEEARPSQ